MSSLLQYLREVRDGGGERKQELVQVHKSRAVAGAVEKGDVSRTLRLRVRARLRSRNSTGQEKERLE